MQIPYVKMTPVGNEEIYLLEALNSGKWAGRGPKTLALEKLAQELTGAKHVFFLTNGTAALEVGCLLAGIKPGDEVITPSFAFVSSANAIVQRGGIPVFADINRGTWNITVETVAPLITKKTKAILPVHYAGNSAGIEELRKLCKDQNIFLIEDAAQSLGAFRDDQAIGPSDAVTCFSLHNTKNISAGEGGLIMTDSNSIASKIEVQIEKGTNRQRFFRGQVDKYTWVDLGSSYIASDLLAAVALGQLEKLRDVTEKRISICNRFQKEIGDFGGLIQWQEIPQNIRTNGHISAFVIDPKIRGKVLEAMKASGVEAQFHYVPLHDSPFAKEQMFAPKMDLPSTRWVSEGLVRLPVYYSMSDEEIDFVIKITKTIVRSFQ
jgi:dTDP-4-amino-4,6-dideoxygalactose transaminase